LFINEKNNNSGGEQEKEVIEIQAVADDNSKRKGKAVEAAFLAKVCKLCPRKARGRGDFPARCRSEEVKVRCAVCPLRGRDA
jgi:hypothetical protein